MTLHCDMCGEKMKRRTATLSAPYRFTLSGLPNIFLAGIDLHGCSQCGVAIPVIPRMGQLTLAIARNLIEKPEALTGAEVRYLRKFARMASKDFAAQLRLKPETYSRIESGTQTMGATADKLSRVVAAAARDMKESRQVTLSQPGSGHAEHWERVVLKPTARGWSEAA